MKSHFRIFVAACLFSVSGMAVSQNPTVLKGEWVSVSDANTVLQISDTKIVTAMGPMVLTATYFVQKADPSGFTVVLDWAGKKENALVLTKGKNIVFTSGEKYRPSTIGGEWRRR